MEAIEKRTYSKFWQSSELIGRISLISTHIVMGISFASPLEITGASKANTYEISSDELKRATAEFKVIQSRSNA